jgi:aryl-alcohol dehydrogenase-like predicted oxidoreductase
MKYRTFGRTDWQVSEIAFGGWQIGGEWGAVDDAESVRTLHHAFERGINFVDTARIYGDGHSEEVVGEALRQWTGDKIYVATKVPPQPWPDQEDDHPVMAGRYPDAYLREGVDLALRRLGVERIDLLQLHSWTASGLESLDWLETLTDLQAAGKIDRIGVSLRDYRPAEGVELARTGLVTSVQVVYNLFEQTPGTELFAAGAGSGTAFVARVPFDSGSLIGHWTEATYDQWPEGSIPKWLFRGDRFAETLRRSRALQELCRPYYPTLAEAALRFSLAAPEVSTVIPGMKDPAEVDMNVAYSDGAPFPAELLAALAPHNWPRNYYV